MTQIVIFIGGVVLGVIFGRMWRDFATQGSKEYRTLSGHPASHYAPSSTAATPSAETRAAPVAAARAERAPPPAPAAAPSAAATRDDLKAIKGVGPRLEALLNEMGITAYRQIAAFTPDDVERVDAELRFHGRIERDDWIGQARRLHADKYGEAV